MRILIVSTLKRKVAPDYFASRSRVIFQLAKGLAERGHQVSLLGTGDSYIPGVKIIPLIEKGWVDLPAVENEFLRQIATLIQLSQKIVEVQEDFDIIHNHVYPDFFPSTIEDKLKIPMLTTLHALYDYYMDDLLATFPKTHFISLSNTYAKLYRKAKIYKIVYNGVDTNLYSYNEKKGPLWQSSFKAVRIVSNVQLLHVSRYIHLNPTSKCLVNKPEDWQFSSYKDYVSNDIFFKKTFKEISISNTKSYMKFVEDQQDYQKKLKQIKNLLLD